MYHCFLFTKFCVHAQNKGKGKKLAEEFLNILEIKQMCYEKALVHCDMHLHIESYESSSYYYT